MPVVATLDLLYRSNHASAMDGMRQIQGAMSGLASGSATATAAVSAVNSGIQMMASSIQVKAVSALIDFGEQALSVAGMVEQTQVSFTRLLGSSEAADKQIREMWDFAAKTPFEFEGLAQAEQRLMAMGFSAKEMIPTLTTIGDATAAMGRPEVMDRIVIAFGQIRNSATLMKQDLNQLTQAGLPAVEILHEKLGLTMQQIANIGHEHIESGRALAAIIEGMNERFGGMMEEQAKTMNGMWSTAKDNVKQLAGEVGGVLLPVVKQVLFEFNQWTNNINQGVQAAKDLAHAVSEIGTEARKAADEQAHLANQIIHETEIMRGIQSFQGSEALGYGMKNLPPQFSSQVWDDAAREATTKLAAHAAEMGEEVKNAFVGAATSEGFADVVGPDGELTTAAETASGEFESMAEVMAGMTDTATACNEAFAGASASCESFEEACTEQIDTFVDCVDAGNEFVDSTQSAADMAMATGESLGDLGTTVFKVEQQFNTTSEAIKMLSSAFYITRASVEALFPTLDGVGERFEAMRKQIGEVTVGYGANALEAFRMFQAEQEAGLRLFAAMDAMGIELTPTINMAADAMLDMFAAAKKHATATNNVADSMQAVADTTLQSVNIGMAGATAAAASVNSGLAQLGAGLSAYGAMAATGTLPGGLPGGVPDFTGGGQTIGYGGATHAPGPASITNPFGSGTPWGGGSHGWAGGPSSGAWGGGVVMVVDGQVLARVTQSQIDRLHGSTSIGVRGT